MKFKFVLLCFIVGLFAQNKFEFVELTNCEKSSFRGISVLNEKCCWISGSQGTVSYTDDGGQTWKNCNPQGFEKYDFRDVHVFDTNSVIIMSSGSPAVILKTSNKGKTWEKKYYNDSPDIFLDSFEFLNDSTGILFGDPIDGEFVILKSIDAGETWYEINQNYIPDALEGEAAFAASGTCVSGYKNLVWIATGGKISRILKSDDSGDSWTASETPMISGINTTGIYSVHFLSDKDGYITGGDYTKVLSADKNFAITKDGGDSWTLSETLPDGFKSSVCSIPNINSGIIVTGTSGTNISWNNGKTWTKINNNSYNSIMFAKNSSVGFLTGDTGKVAKIIIR